VPSRLDGNQIRRWQIIAGLTQMEAAELCRVPFRTYQRWLKIGLKRDQMVEPLKQAAVAAAQSRAETPSRIVIKLERSMRNLRHFDVVQPQK
jgi:hypothetical protein